MFKNPTFWNNKQWINYLLLPLSWLWVYVGRLKANSVTPERVSVPVICVGNVVMGGAGKTPTVLALLDILKELGHKPHVISRGYGAYIREVRRVDPARHTYLQVGDEPLLLAQTAPTWAGPNRVFSAHNAIANGATVLIMDDGLQNETLVKDLSFLVVDTVQGMGNGMIFPAGPLRESIESGERRAQATIVIGENAPTEITHNKQFHAKIEANNEPHAKRVIAFCGMGFPEKFRHTLIQQGYTVLDFIVFADHHPYTIPDMMRLMRLRDEHQVTLITTSKDWIRIPQTYRDDVDVLGVSLVFSERAALKEFIHVHINQ